MSPTATKRVCAKCHSVHAERRCPTCEQERKAFVDAHRSSATERGYDATWIKYSRMYRRNNPLCVQCLKQGVFTSVEGRRGCVDHIVPHRGDRSLFWAPGNHQSLCIACHSRKTAAEDGGFGNKGGGG